MAAFYQTEVSGKAGVKNIVHSCKWITIMQNLSQFISFKDITEAKHKHTDVDCTL